MKNLVAAFLLVTATFAFSGPAGFLTQKTENWNFIQSVGGMKVSVRDNVLIVDCDVSGLRKVTVEPTTIHSAMAVRRLKYKMVGNTLQLALVTSVLERGLTTTCRAVDLASYPAGEYSVEYRDPDGTTHALGKIT